MKKSILGGAVLLTGLAVHHSVQADEVNQGNSSETHEVVSSQTLDKEVKTQETVVNDLTNQVQTATDEFNKASQELDQAKQIADYTGPQEILEVKSDISTAKELVNKSNTILNEVKNSQLQAEEEVLVAQSHLDEKSKQVQELKADESKLSQQLEQIKSDTLDPKTIETELNVSEKTVAEKEQVVVTAQKKVENIKALESQKEQKISEFHQEINALILQKDKLASDVSSKEAVVKAKEKTIDIAQAALVIAENDYKGINQLIVSPEYVKALRTYSDYSLSQSERDAAEQKLVTLSKTLASENTFKENLNDSSTKFDINNLSLEVSQELSLFAQDLLNQVRQAFGTAEVRVTSSALDFAKAVQAKDVASQWNTLKNGHNEMVLTEVSRSYFLKGTDTEVNLVEDWGGSYHANGKLSLNELKASIYKRITEMLYPTKYLEFLHAKDLSGLNEPLLGSHKTVDYFAVTTTYIDGVAGIHFITIGDSLFSPQTEFKTDGLTASKSHEDIVKSYNLAKEKYDTAVKEKTLAISEVVKAQSQLEDISVKLSSKKTELSDLVLQNSSLNKANEELDEAKTDLINAKREYDALKLKLEFLSKSWAEKQTVISGLEKELESKRKDLMVSQMEENSANSKLKNAKENLTKILSSLSKAQANVSKAKETLGMLEEELYKLENAPKLLKEAEENFNTTKTKLLMSLTKLKTETERLEFLKAQMSTLQEIRQKDTNQSLPVFSSQGTFVGYSKPQSVMASKDKQIVNNQAKNLPDTGSDTSPFTLLFGASLTFIGLLSTRIKRFNH